MTVDLNRKTALVTGAGKKSGIGYGIARKLSAGGANVILADLIGKETRQDTPASASMDQIAALAADLAKTFKIKALALELDVTAGDSVAQLADKVQQQFGQIHILCNNAGAVFGVP
ncbi:MAG: SDR family oxidoreductase, partial [Desulfobacterales bacterium]